MLCKVEKGQDPYTVIGNYISDHIKYLEDMIATISIDGKTTNELLMVDVNEPGYFVWESDWWEGEDDIGLVDFFSVSDACNPREQQWIPCSERMPEEFLYCADGLEGSEEVLITAYCDVDGDYVVDTARTIDTRWYSQTTKMYIPDDWEVLAWMSSPEPYKP